MQCPGGRHIKQLGMPIIHRILLPCGRKNKHRIEFQPLRIFHRQHHNPAAKCSFLQIAFHHLHIFRQFCGRPDRFLPFAANHGNRIQPLFLPNLTNFGRFPQQGLPIRKPLYPHRASMPDNRLHRITEKTSMMQNIRSKIRYFYRIPVTLFQDSKAVHGICQKQPPEFLPIIQAVAKMNILGDIPHNRISAPPDAEFQRPVCHHPEILGFINYYMMRFTDNLLFLYTRIEIGQCRQIIDIKFRFRNLHPIPFFTLFPQKISIHFKYGLLPCPAAVSSTVSL